MSPNGPHNYNIAGASSTLAPAQIGVTCRSLNVPLVCEDNPTVTLNYRAEYLQMGDALQRGLHARPLQPQQSEEPYAIQESRMRFRKFELSSTLLLPVIVF